MDELAKMPNIGPVLAEKLKKTGIKTPASLKKEGSTSAFLKIRLQADPEACLHALLALEGAIQNVPKSTLPMEKKMELKDFFDKLS